MTAQPKRPKLSVIVGGAGKLEEPEATAILRSDMSPEGRARLLRAQRLVGAERAFLFVWNDTEFTLSQAAACDENGGEPRDRNVMWSLLDRITSQRAPLVMAGTDEQPSDAMMSGVTPPLRMAIGVPIISGDDLKGVVCFDKRIHKGQFVDSDVRAVSTILEALSFNAAGLRGLVTGNDLPEREPTAPEIAARLHAAMGPVAASSDGFRVHATLSSPRLTEVSFWHRQVLSNGVVRLQLCRLTSPQTGSDLLVARQLGCYRALSLLAEAGSHEQLCALPFEIERLSSDAFTLHASAIELSPDGTVSLWHAGSGSLERVSAAGESTLVLAPSEPFTRGKRPTLFASTRLDEGDKLTYVHGPDSLERDGLRLGSSERPPGELPPPGVSTWLITRDT